MEQIIIYLLMVQKFINLKQKFLRLYQHHYAQETSRKTGQQIIRKGLNGYVFYFSVDYNDTAVDDTLDIYKYFMKKNIMI